MSKQKLHQCGDLMLVESNPLGDPDQVEGFGDRIHSVTKPKDTYTSISSLSQKALAALESVLSYAFQ